LSPGLLERIKTALIIGLPILFLVFFSDHTRLIFLSLMILLTTVEFLGLHYKSLSKEILPWGAALVLTGLVYALLLTRIIPTQIYLSCAVLFTLRLLFFLYRSDNYGQKRTPWLASLMFTMLPIGTLLTFYDKAEFKYVLIGVLLLVWVSDISAYFVGKSIGKHKLMPSVSPGKTKEGFLGAGMVTVLCSYLLYAGLGHFTFRQWTIMALLVWLLGSAGDLVESKMKRSLGIKDSGNILPGHGGFLDRFDGFIFCLPAVSAYIYWTTCT